MVYPEIDPVALALGPFKVHWYGLTYLGGLFFAWWLAVVADLECLVARKSQHANKYCAKKYYAPLLLRQSPS